MKSKHTRVNNKQTTQPAFMKILTFASLITLCIVFYSLPSAHGSELYSNDMISSQLGRDLLSVDTPSDAERKAAQKIIDRDAQLPRYIFFTNGGKLKSYPAKFCGGDNVDNCDTAHYAESILLTSAIGFIVAIVALLFGIVFWIFRCCCFGGCHASSGVCCPGDRYDEGMGSGYSNKHVLLVKLATVATLICLIPFFVVGHVGNADFTSAKNQFTGTILDAAQLVVSNLQEVNHTFSTLPAIPGIDLSQVDQALTTALTAGQDVIVQGKNIENTADHYNSIRQQVILAGLILPLVIIGATMIAGLFNLAPLALFGATVGFIVLSYGWIAFSIHYPLSLVSSDVCSTFAESGINGFVPIPGNTTYGLNNTTPNVIVNSLLKCGLEGDNSDNPFKPLLDIAQTGLTYAFDQVCNGFDQICDQTFPCGVDAITGDITYCHVMNCPADVTCNATTVSSYLKANITDFDLGCVVGNALVCPYSGPCANDRLAVCNPTPILFEDCPDSCRLPQARNVTGVVVTGLNLLIKFEDILINNIIPLLDCSFISGVFGGVQDAICVTMVNSLVYISVGEAGLSIFMISGVILSILGIKRFNSANREGKEGSSHY